MTDLIARLRAVNPVAACDPPAIENVWRRLEYEDQAPGRRPPHPGPHRSARRIHIHLFSSARHVGLGIAVAIPVLVAVLALVLLAHNPAGRPASAPQATHPRPTPGTRTSIDALLARGVHPLAPDAELALPILGSSGARSLASFRGKVVVLNVFASWCPPCRREAATLDQAQTRIADQDATVLGVTYLDNPAASQKFMHGAHITYPVLRDVNRRLARSLQVPGVPDTFVIDPRGRIVAVQVGEVNEAWLTQALAGVLPGGSPGRLGPTGMQTKPPPTASELAAMISAYPVLGHPQQPTDIPPYGALDPFVLSQGGLIANARRAVVTSRGESLYIVAADHSICVTSSDNVVQGCQPFPFTATTRAAIDATICAPELPPTELEVAGLMPPAASDIKVRYSNGSSRPITATNGVIALYAPIKGSLPDSITWMSPTGPQRSLTGVPPDAASTKCAS